MKSTLKVVLALTVLLLASDSLIHAAETKLNVPSIAVDDMNNDLGCYEMLAGFGCSVPVRPACLHLGHAEQYPFVDARPHDPGIELSINGVWQWGNSDIKAPGEPEVIGGFSTLEKVYSSEPLPAVLPADKHKHILGAQGNLWSEYFYPPTLPKFEYQAHPRACALAELNWTPACQRNLGEFLARLAAHMKRLDALKVNHRHLDASPLNQTRPNNRQTKCHA